MNTDNTRLKRSPFFRWSHSPYGFLVAALLCFYNQTVSGYQGEAIPGEVTASMIEQQDNYIVRISLPGRNLWTLNMCLQGNRLHLEAPSDGKYGRYEQDLVLEAASTTQNPRVDRREAESTVVLTVPKGSDSSQQPAALADQNDPSLSTDAFDGIERIMAQQLQQMQKQMEQMLGGALPQSATFMGSGLDSFGGDALSKINLEEQKDKYVVRANLPNPRIGKINVDIKEQVLTIEAKEENTQQGNGNRACFSQQSEYSQSMRLPGPVEIGKMKVDRSGDTLVITLPKASSVKDRG